MVFAIIETCVMNRSIAIDPPLSANHGPRNSLRTVGRTKRLAAEMRALSANARLTTAKGHPRSKDVYCGKMTPMPVAMPLMRRTKMTVNAGFGVENRVRSEVQEERHDRSRIRASECCWEDG